MTIGHYRNGICGGGFTALFFGGNFRFGRNDALFPSWESVVGTFTFKGAFLGVHDQGKRG